jgi:putative phosphoesterase
MCSPTRDPAVHHVGIISDTHGLVRPEALDALRGSDLIVHAGDVGDASVIDQLRQVAPTVAVRGNIDVGAWGRTLPATRTVEVGALRLFVLHEISSLSLDPKAASFAAVIFGHSHRASAEVKDGVLYLNPGSAGPRRFTLPISLAKLRVVETRLTHEIVELRIHGR